MAKLKSLLAAVPMLAAATLGAGAATISLPEATVGTPGSTSGQTSEDEAIITFGNIVEDQEISLDFFVRDQFSCRASNASTLDFCTARSVIGYVSVANVTDPAIQVFGAGPIDGANSTLANSRRFARLTTTVNAANPSLRVSWTKDIFQQPVVTTELVQRPFAPLGELALQTTTVPGVSAIFAVSLFFDDSLTFAITDPNAGGGDPTPEPVPVPGAMLLLGTAVAGLGAIKRAKSRRQV